MNKGYGFDFPDEDYRDPTIFTGHRTFYLDGGKILVWNKVIIAATGKYRAYVGGSLIEDLLAFEPYLVFTVTLVMPETGDATEEAEGEGVLATTILDPAIWTQPVYTNTTDPATPVIAGQFLYEMSDGDTRIGTDQGFYFPFDNGEDGTHGE